MPEPVSWAQLVVLMAFGNGESESESVRGVLHRRETRELSGDDDFAGEVLDHPTLGRLAVEESTKRVLRRGRLVRWERIDGTPRAIYGADTIWLFGQDSNVPDAHERNRGWWADEGLVQRPSLRRWEGNDFTQLTGPIEPVEYLGRSAWAFELAPPPHKPFPLQMIVDAQTGLLLREANRDFDSVTEWTSLEIGVELPDELFTWDGPVRDAAELRAEREAEHEADVATRRTWLSARGVAGLPFDVEPELMLHEWDDESGAFHASLDLRVGASLLRRPHSEQPWAEADTLHWEHAHRWSDERWDWCLGTNAALNDEQFARLERHLAATT